MEVEYRGIYTTLDSLLDTRIASIQVLFPKLFNRLIETKAYLDRTSDLIKVDDELFSLKAIDAFYRGRNPLLLTIAPPTKIIYAILRLFGDYVSATDIYNSNNGFKLIVNTYPYDLNPLDANILIGKINGMLNDIATVEFVYLDEETMLVEDLDKYNIIDMVVYDAYRWFSRMLVRSNILVDGGILNKRLITTRPNVTLSKDNGILVDPSSTRSKDEELVDIIKYLISNAILDYDLFSYIPVDENMKF